MSTRCHKLRVSRVEKAIVSLLREGGPIELIRAYRSIDARLGLLGAPKHALKGLPYRRKGKTLYVDTYQYGDVANVDHRTRFARKKSAKPWNDPMPFPADFASLIRAVRSPKTKKVVLGINNDPMAWMDLKYGFTLEFLAMLRTKPHIRSLRINTRSDLIAHNSYLNTLCLLASSGMRITVAMHMPRGPAYLARLSEPGAPGNKRRLKAVRALRESGIHVNLVRKAIGRKYWNLIKKRKKRR